MSTDTAAVLRELEESLSRSPDREAMRKECEEMDRLREQTEKRVGIVDVTVEMVREARNR